MEVIQADRDAAARFVVGMNETHTNYLKHKIENGTRDHHPLVQAFARHRLPMDDNSLDFSNSTLPIDMIRAGEDVLEKCDLELANGSFDWDYGMVAVAVYRAMTERYFSNL